ncbi:hypothetical protein B0T17DRAFT_619207 [Bombardia bombarda]|uniref:DUF6603 domain-containing protein n=1 Tax=Bombardia bombarda TaxID=252184 RepID=A0AA39WHL8_9PEZI|nr:hypothetical protein B0T17DRAFT_619207 [Bombardia bombarda]
MAFYRVDSFHINVDAGDGAIHILSKPGTTTDGCRDVCKAVFLDGGKKDNGAWRDSIDTTILAIEQAFNCQSKYVLKNQNGRPYLLFDVFVVSHWDADHYEGVMEFLRADVGKWPHGAANAKKTKVLRACYDTNGNPKSYFFAPYFMDQSEGVKEKFEHHFQVNTTKKTLDILSNDGFTWAKDTLLPRTKSAELLGRNFFDLREYDDQIDLDPPQADPWNYMTSIAKLVEINPLLPQLALGNNGVTDKTLTETNKSSISNMIVWSNEHVSHYFAGDADAKLERRIIEWANCQVTNVKLSHHGSSSSTPLPYMFDTFNPKNMFASAGGGGYGHPRWELLFAIHEWLKVQSLKVGPVNTAPLFLSQYPEYMIQDKKGFFDLASRFKVHAVDDYDDPMLKAAKKWEDEAAKARGKTSLLKKPIQKLSLFFKNWAAKKQKKGTLTPESRKKKILKTILTFISDVTSTPPDTAAMVNYAFGKAGPMPASYKDYITYVCFTSLATLNLGDGQATVRFANGCDQVYNEATKPRVYNLRTRGVKPNGLGLVHVVEDGDDDDDDDDPVVTVRNPGVDRPGARDMTITYKGNGSTSIRNTDKPAGHRRTWSWDMVDSESDDWDALTDDDSDSNSDSESDWLDPVSLTTRLTSGILIDNPDATGVCYFVSETAKQPNLPPNTTKVVVLQDHPLFLFIDSLHQRSFVLQKNPSDPATAVFFDPLDSWVAWFSAIHAPPGDCTMSMTAGAWPVTKDTAIDFSVTFSPVPDHTITLTTAAAATAFSDITPPALQKMLTDRITMVFALAPGTQPFSTTIGAVAEHVGFDLDKFSAIRLLKAVELTFDTAADARNAMWFRPSPQHETNLRLQFSLDTRALDDWLGGVIKGVSISDVVVVARKTATCKFGAVDDWAVCEGELAFAMRLDVGEASFDAVVDVRSRAVNLMLSSPSTMKKKPDGDEPPTDVIGALFKWFQSLPGLESVDLEGLLKKADEVIDRKRIAPRRVEMSLSLNEDGSLAGIQTACITIEASVTIGKPKDQPGKPLAFLFELGWGRSSGVYLRGSLWCAPPVLSSSLYLKALPGYEPYSVLQPVTLPPGERLTNLDLKTLMSDSTVNNLPKGIPTEIAHAVIEISQKGISFSGIIRCTDTDDVKNRPPTFCLETVSLAAGYNWGKDSDKGFHLSLGIDLLLFKNAKYDETIEPVLQDPARLKGTLQYKGEAWTLGANIDNLTVGHIAQFWDVDSRSSVMEFLSHIEMENLSLTYHYEKVEGGRGTEFDIAGTLKVAKMLRLSLKYHNSGDGWEFKASVSEVNPKDPITIGKVLEAVLDSTLDDLPAPIKNAEISPGGDKEFFVLRCFEHNGTVFFTVMLNIGSIRLCFTQFRGKDWDKKRASKRFIKAAIAEVSVTVPMMGTLKQPFEQMYYLWVQDGQPSKNDKDARGITLEEFDALKSTRQSSTEQLFYKSEKEKTDDKEVVIAAGSHFFIVAKDSGSGIDKVILDYVFGKPKPQAPRGFHRQRALMAPEPAGEKGSKSAFKKALGPLSIDSIGLYYREGRIGITLDATFLMGPIGLSLLGFSIDVPFDKDHNLSKPPGISDVNFSLQGLLVSFEKPPITIAGGFMHSKMNGLECYAGGLILKFDPYMFQAMGVYATVPKPEKTKAIAKWKDPKAKDEETYTMVFIFCKLNGPLFSVGFADFSGLTAGVGINSDIALPTVDQVVEFPFVKPDGTGSPTDTPVTTLTKLMKGIWFRPAEGSFWIAAGVKATAFQMLIVDAVLVVQFSPNVKLGICAVASADMPSSRSNFRVAHIELGIVCTLDIDSGVFKLEAQLSPKSFVLHPSCHLTGGMALYSWFKNTPNGGVAGDWVLTIGGYHQAFNAPSQYPRPPRLGINWSLGNNLSITGEAYFAVTPNVCMAGGRLHAALTLGGLSAWFDAFLDFLVNFEPFYFKGTASIAVGIRYTMDLWICTIRISAEIGATLSVTGPPFAGNVHVDFWVFGFDIGFGTPAPPPSRLSIDAFWDLALKSSSSSGKNLGLSADLLAGRGAAATVAEREPAFLITCQGGLEPEGKEVASGKSDSIVPSSHTLDDPPKPAGKPWVVRAGKFSFLVTFRFAVNDAKLEKNHRGTKGEKPQDIPIPAESQSIYARPMQLYEGLSSKCTVLVHQEAHHAVALRQETIPGSVRIYESWAKREWEVQAVQKPVERSLWDQYNPNLDPLVSGNKVGALLTGDKPTMPLVMAVSIKPPTPQLAPDEELKFNVVEDMKQPVLSSKLPKFPPADEGGALPAWSPQPEKTTWKDVQDKWKGKSEGDDVPERAVDIWAKRLGLVTADGKSKITGKRPKVLIENFKTRVPALPMIAMGLSLGGVRVRGGGGGSDARLH